jgi:hypothetical protein
MACQTELSRSAAGGVLSQDRNTASDAFRGATGVSFRMRKRRETGKDSARKGQRGRAARLHQSFPCFPSHGCSREPLRPPHLSPKADHGAAASSFLYFERDPHGPGGHSQVGTGTAHGARKSNQCDTMSNRVRWTVSHLWGCPGR